MPAKRLGRNSINTPVKVISMLSSDSLTADRILLDLKKIVIYYVTTGICMTFMILKGFLFSSFMSIKESIIILAAIYEKNCQVHSSRALTMNQTTVLINMNKITIIYK